MIATGAGRTARREPPPWQHLDIVLMLSTLLVAVIGVIMVYSATRGPATLEDPANTFFLQRQALFLIAGVILMGVTAFFDYRSLRDFVTTGYLVLLGILCIVLVAGVEVNGARAWFRIGSFQLQPSEFGKIVLILALASFFASGEEIDMRRLALGLGIASAPVALILLQPDLGTVLVFGAVTFGIVLVGGARGRHLVGLCILGMVGTVVLLNSNVLAEYQVDRLTVFINEDADPEAAYNQRQAEIAIGNGGLTGQGLFDGTQNRGGLVPEQQTDFIFTVVGEELGFFGSATLLFLYLVVLARIYRIAQLSSDMFGTLVCIGVLSMLLFQIFQSVGMTMGMMPVTGIPLPFVSYGGSSILTSFIALGLVLNVHMHRYR